MLTFWYNLFMITIEKEVKVNNENLIPEKSLFFDIETTGFSRAFSRIYLIGTLGKEDGKFVFRQFLTENRNEEKKLIETFLNLIKDYEKIISFNGDTFDFHFIKARAEKYNIDPDFSTFESIDILKKVKERSFFLELDNYKLKTLERYIGIFREDIFSGGELISLYYDYENGDKDLEGILLLHNEEDILNMPNLYSLKTLLEEKNRITLGDYEFNIEKISLGKAKLEVRGHSNLGPVFLTSSFGNLVIDSQNFVFTSLINQGDYDNTRKCLFIEKQNLSLSCNYRIKAPESIYLLKLDKKQLNLNIKSYFEETLKNLFKDI